MSTQLPNPAQISDIWKVGPWRTVLPDSYNPKLHGSLYVALPHDEVFSFIPTGSFPASEPPVSALFWPQLHTETDLGRLHQALQHETAQDGLYLTGTITSTDDQ